MFDVMMTEKKSTHSLTHLITAAIHRLTPLPLHAIQTSLLSTHTVVH